MAIQDDFTIDYVDRKITYTTAFVDDRPPSIYTVNELYSYLQDTFDEPAQMDEPIPMSAQTPTQYTMLYPWFIDNESVKALYGGSIQTSSWTKSSSDGVTTLRWANGAADAPVAGDIGVTLTGGTSTATGVLLAVDTTRQVVWVRNTSAAQFQGNEAVTGTGVSFTTETNQGFQTGENVWSNLFSVGSLQTETEIYVGQEDDYMGGTAYHGVDAAAQLERRIEKIDEWWDSDVDFFTGSPNLLGGINHFDILVLTQEMDSVIDGSRLAVFARQFSKVYSSFELVGGVGNFVVPFASTGADLNSQEGPYSATFAALGAGTWGVGTVLENSSESPAGRLRAVITAIDVPAGPGTIEYYLIGENEPLTTTDRTLNQLTNTATYRDRDNPTFTGALTGAPASVSDGPAVANPGAGTIAITFADTQFDVDEDSTDEEYACTINCANNPLATVYRRLQFLTSRGNQDGTTTDTQDELLPSGISGTGEASEFYRAVGDVVITWDANAGTGLTEGQLVDGSISGATGVVVSATTGATGTGVLTQVKGSFVDNDVVSDIGDGVTNTVTLDAAPSSIVDNTAAPFGTFAGGRFFVAQGILLTNVPAADANNWQTIDLTGTVKAPPTQRSITFAGLTVNDRAALFEVDTAGGIDVTKNQNGVGVAGAAVSDTSIPLDTTVALDVPTSGWIRIVDTSSTTGEEYRYEYSAVSGTTVTLRTGAGLTGTTTSLGTSTVLNDTGAFTNYGTDGNVKTGMEIRLTAGGERAVVLRQIDNDSIETTVLSGAAVWGNGVGWEANQIVVALVDADTIYFPFIDDEVQTGTTLTSTVKYVADTPLVARARFSDPDVGGTRILPFEQRSVTLTDANLTVTAIRTTDTIAS